jgi:rhodanese-related sulfurtransferase
MAASVITEHMVAIVTPNQLVTLLATPGVDVVDVRNRDEWDAGHIEGTRLVPLDQLRANAEVVLDPSKTIVFVCAKGRAQHGGREASRAARIPPGREPGRWHEGVAPGRLDAGDRLARRRVTISSR